MFVIDDDNGIAWFDNWTEADGPLPGHAFDSLRQIEVVAGLRKWSKQDVTAIWNSFAGTAGFDDLKPQKCFKNRPYGLEQIWKAIQRLVPADDSSTYATAQGKEFKGAYAPVADTEKMPKKKAKAKKAVVAEVEAKSGENIQDLIRLMKRKNGVSIDEAMAAIGWNATHTVRGRISVLKSKGMAIESTKHETRGRVYRVA